MSKKAIFLIILLIGTSLSSTMAQNDAIKDLLKQLDTASTKVIQADIYTQLSDEAVFTNPNQGFEYATKALKLAKAASNKYYIAYAYSCLAYCRYYQSRYNEALKYLKKDYPIYQALDDTTGMIFSLSHQGDSYAYLGDNKKAITLLEEALSLSKQVNDYASVSDILNKIGMTYSDMAEYRKGLKYLEEAYLLDIKYDTGGAQVTNHNKGVVKSAMGDYDEAMRLFRSSLKESKYKSTDYEYGLSITNIGSLHQTMGEYDSALIYYMQYLQIVKNFENNFDEAWAYHQIADVQLELKEYEQATLNVKKVIDLYKSAEIELYETDALITLSKIQIETQKYSIANQTINKGFKSAKKLNSKKQIAEFYNLLGTLNAKQNKSEIALKHHQAALLLFQEIGSKSDFAQTLYYIAQSQQALRFYSDAFENAQQSLEIVKAINYRAFLDDLYLLLSENAAEAGDFKTAYQYQKILQNLQDSVLNIEKTKRIVELETEFYVSEKDAENERLKLKQAESKLTIQRRTILGIAFGLEPAFIGWVCLLALSIQ